MSFSNEIPGLSLEHCVRVFSRRKVAFLVSSVLVAMGVFVALLLVPRSYESKARLFVRVGRESVSLDPTATTGQMMAVYDSRKSEVESVLDMLDSRDLLEAVISKIGAEVNADEPIESPLQQARLIKSLAESITHDRNNNSNIITVTCKSRTPELARQILTEYLAAFREEYMQAHRTDGSLEFFEEQTQLLSQRLESVQEVLSKKRNSLNVGSIPKQRENLQLLLGDIETQLFTATANAAESRTRIETTRRLRNELPQRMLATNVETNSAFDQGREKLHELQIQESELRQRYTPSHPRMLALKDQMVSAQKILDEYSQTSSSRDDAIGPVRQQLELDLLQQEAQAAAVVSRIKSLSEQKAEIYKRIRTLNEHEGPLQSLQDEVALLQNKHLAYAERLEQSRINQDLSKALISNVNEIQPPSLIPDPVSPRRKTVMGLGILFAGICGCVVVISLELIDPKVLIAGKDGQTVITPTPEKTTRAESETASKFVAHAFN